MARRIALTACAVVLAAGPLCALAQTFDEVTDPLESAITDLQSALDDVESARSSAQDDPVGGVRAIRQAQREMRSTAISLLLASMDPKRRPKEYQRTLDAVRLLEPKLLDEPKSH